MLSLLRRDKRSSMLAKSRSITCRRDVDPTWKWELRSQAYVLKQEWYALSDNDARNEYIQRNYGNKQRDIAYQSTPAIQMWSVGTNIYCRCFNGYDWLKAGTLKYAPGDYMYNDDRVALYFYVRYQTPEEIAEERRLAEEARQRAEEHEDELEDSLDIDIERCDARFMRYTENYPLAVKGVRIGKLPASPLLASIDDEDLLLKIFGNGDISPWASNAMKRMETAFGIDKRSVRSLFGF